MSEIGEYYEFAIDLAIKSGVYLSEGYKTKFDWKETSLNTKVDQSDLVTEFDKKIESFIFDRIREKYPTHKCIGEESSSEGKKWSLTDEPTWIVDPIDGTTNFVHGFPYTCVSIAVAVKQEVVVGVVHNPILNELFTAQKGKGAYLNGTKRLPLSYPNVQPLPSINEALFLAEYGGQRNLAELLPKVNSMHRLTLSKDDGGAHCRGIRALGACAMNMTLLAKGGADMFWETGPHIWDYAASMLILREAGGIVISHGGTYGKEDQDIKFEDYQTFDLCARKVVCVRATDKVLLNRDLNNPEEIKNAEEHSFSLLREALKYIEDIPIERDGE